MIFSKIDSVVPVRISSIAQMCIIIRTEYYFLGFKYKVVEKFNTFY